MKEMLDLITPGQILENEYLTPLNISQNRLARDLDIAPSRVHGIIHGTRSITADMALRLAKYFGTSAQMWLNLQSHYELEKAERDDWPQIEPRIRTLPAADMPL